MSNRFSFLENSTTLINNLISFNENASLLKYISKLINDLTELFEYFNQLFGLLLLALKQHRDALHSIEKEYIYHFYTQFKRLEEIVRKQKIELSVATFRSLFREVINSTRIPFAGEPLNIIRQRLNRVA